MAFWNKEEIFKCYHCKHIISSEVKYVMLVNEYRYSEGAWEVEESICKDCLEGVFNIIQSVCDCVCGQRSHIVFIREVRYPLKTDKGVRYKGEDYRVVEVEKEEEIKPRPEKKKVKNKAKAKKK